MGEGKGKLGRKVVIQLTLEDYNASLEKVRTGTHTGQELGLMQRQWRDVTYWLASPAFLSLLSYRTQDYQPRNGTTHKASHLDQ